MSPLPLSHEADIVAQAAHRISTAADYDRLIELAGAAQFVLIGEASHGTHDFYATRAELARRLVLQEKVNLGQITESEGSTRQIIFIVSGYDNRPDGFRCE